MKVTPTFIDFNITKLFMNCRFHDYHEVHVQLHDTSLLTCTYNIAEICLGGCV